MANRVTVNLALGLLFGMIAMLAYLDWRIALPAFIAAALGATAEANAR
jgi:uncharacterized membrane protein YjjP (DUF1212 family)